MSGLCLFRVRPLTLGCLSLCLFVALSLPCGFFLCIKGTDHAARFLFNLKETPLLTDAGLAHIIAAAVDEEILFAAAVGVVSLFLQAALRFLTSESACSALSRETSDPCG